MGPLEQKLTERIKKMQEAGLKNISFSAGFQRTTDREAVAQAMLEWLDVSDKWEALSTEEKMKQQIKQVYDEPHPILDLCRSPIDEEWTEDKKKLHRIFSTVDMALVTLGNWIR